MAKYSCTLGENGQGRDIIYIKNSYDVLTSTGWAFKSVKKSAVKYRILNFDMTSLKGKYVTIKRARTLCNDQTLAEIEAVSVGAAIFFSWCMVTIDAFEMLT